MDHSPGVRPPLFFAGQSAPLAIAMWDFSWLLRSYAGGGFEDWDLALDGLVERGYNAVRIDCFPHLIAADAAGTTRERFLFPGKNAWDFWENRWTFETNVRTGMLSFLGKCRERNVRVALSTWLKETEPPRAGTLGGPDEFARVWAETLSLIEREGFLADVVYVDLANEYPLWHGWKWLTDGIAARRGAGGDSEIGPDTAKFNLEQRLFYWEAIRNVINRLRTRWPDLSFGVSQTYNYWEEQKDYDYSGFDFLDLHLWFIHARKFIDPTGYWEFHKLENDARFGQINDAIHRVWKSDRTAWMDWVESKVRQNAKVAGRWGIPVGNTEGWGPVFWLDHPLLDWGWVKETGECGVRLGEKYGYAFNCTSNFTHPFFKGIWGDVGWHQRMTKLICADGKPPASRPSQPESEGF